MLRRSAVSRGTRVLMVSSMTHHGGRLDFSDLQACADHLCCHAIDKLYYSAGGASQSPFDNVECRGMSSLHTCRSDCFTSTTIA